MDEGITAKNGVPTTGEWDDSLAGNFLWTNANFAEAISDVMMPCTWSMWQIYIGQIVPVQLPGNYPLAGNIGGRPYLNLSIIASLSRVFGRDSRDVLQHSEGMFGRIPENIEIPTTPIFLGTVLRSFLPGLFTVRKQIWSYSRQTRSFLDTAADWCVETQKRIQTTQDKAALVTPWWEAMLPYIKRIFWILRAVTKQFSAPSGALRLHLLDLVGEADTNTLLSNLRGAGDLESPGPVMGLPTQTAAATSTTRTLPQPPHGQRLPEALPARLVLSKVSCAR